MVITVPPPGPRNFSACAAEPFFPISQTSRPAFLSSSLSCPFLVVLVVLVPLDISWPQTRRSCPCPPNPPSLDLSRLSELFSSFLFFYLLADPSLKYSCIFSLSLSFFFPPRGFFGALFSHFIPNTVHTARGKESLGLFGKAKKKGRIKKKCQQRLNTSFFIFCSFRSQFRSFGRKKLPGK